MNKAFTFILFTLCIIYIKSDFRECEQNQGSFPNEDTDDRINYCHVRTNTQDKTHCCYYRSSKYQNGTCKEITDDQYENIKRYKTFLKNSEEDVKIQCSSKYVAYSLFVLLALLF